jgi:thiol-disulfide isomerase/thioredoxin
MMGAPARFSLSAAILMLMLSGCGGSRLATEPHPLLSTAPPTRQEMALDGSILRLPRPGRVTLIDFWATSCEPCVRMMPSVEAIWREKGSAGLQVVGVASDDNPGLVQERLRQLAVSYPNVVDADGTVRGSYRVDSIPTTILLDRQGRVRVAHRGGNEKSLTAIREAVDVLLGER